MKPMNRKVIILMDMPLYPYRIYCYNELVKRGYDLTVVSVSNKDLVYNIPLLFNHKRYGFKQIFGFIWLKGFSLKELDEYDRIIVTPNLRVINFFPLLGNTYTEETLAWGHLTGRTANNKLAERFRYKRFNKFPALIFYESGTRDEFVEHGFNPEKLFVANNTQYVEPDTVIRGLPKEYFLYVGRIQERKGVDLALRAFAKLKHESKDDRLKFVIVGGGDKEALVKEAQEEGVKDSVEFTGAIHDQKKLGEVFSKAYAYVSPGHVGLGVLHSLACGVPVITCSDRLHSVEITNCKPDNSLVVPYTVDDVEEAMRKLYSDTELQNRLSEAAYKYYQEFCTIDKMVDGIDDALKYVEQLKKK